MDDDEVGVVYPTSAVVAEGAGIAELLVRLATTPYDDVTVVFALQVVTPACLRLVASEEPRAGDYLIGSSSFPSATLSPSFPRAPFAVPFPGCHLFVPKDRQSCLPKSTSGLRGPHRSLLEQQRFLPQHVSPPPLVFPPSPLRFPF